MVKKMGFYINMAACIGCRTCQIACKDKNNLKVGILYRRVRSWETGKYPEPGYFHYSAACNHCTNPRCILTCPTKSMHFAEDGTVRHNPKICILCQYCVRNCPYGVPQYSEKDETIGKCDSCADLRAQGFNPACVDACLMRCIEWGVLDELREKHAGEGITSDIAVLPSSATTTPSVLIRPHRNAHDENPVETEI